MQPDAERDRAVEQALRQTLRASANEPMGDHIDGETLAAWTEGQLRADEAARLEQHLSDCAPCQQLLATFARTSPPPIVSEPMWRRWRLQWLVPIATAATVAALWVAAPREPSQVSTPISDQTVPASPPATTRNEAPQLAPAEPAPQAAPRRLQDADERSAAKAFAPKSAPASALGAPAPAPLEKKEESTLDRRDSFEVVAPQAGAAREADAGAREEQERRKLTEAAETVQLSRQAQTATAAQPAPPAPAAPAAAPPPAPTIGALARSANAARTLAKPTFRSQPEIASPNSTFRWRIVNDTRVERTTNGGSDWQAAVLPSTSVLTAGSSPASAICWIVGRGGTVLITTDGLRFARVKFPESLDLVSITATDDRHATVMSADGRSFRTDDQGVTWTR